MMVAGIYDDALLQEDTSGNAKWAIPTPAPAREIEGLWKLHPSTHNSASCQGLAVVGMRT